MNETLSPLSYFFARFIAEEYRLDPDNPAVLSAAWVSERNQQGDTCVDLRDFAEKSLFEADFGQGAQCFTAPDYASWRDFLESQPCIGKPGEIAALIFEAPRFYLGRVWRDENRVRESILARLDTEQTLDEGLLIQGLERLFPKTSESGQADWQKVACAIALCRRLAILSGGPGTGKTTTLVKVLALLLEQNPKLRIGLAAPTGKAAARMVESICDRKRHIAVEESIRTRIPEEAATLHRLLEYDGYRFRVDAGNPLALDCLVIDEASMIDLSLMARILNALPARARLILLGDRDQLASVEAGNVLADLCGNGHAIEYSPSFAQRLAHLVNAPSEVFAVRADSPRMADSIALLHHSYRFGANSPIARLAASVNGGQARQAHDLLQQQGLQQIVWREMKSQTLDSSVLRDTIDHYRDFLQAENPEQALERVESFRVLCATRHGPNGTIEVNRLIEEALFRKSVHSDQDLHKGKLILVTVNDYENNLYNGDIGLIWPDSQGRLKAWFKLSGKPCRSLAPRDLPEHIPAWAMTVHKSQGSEFDRVLLILPDEESPVVCRELIYTAITRCRKSLVIHAKRNVFMSGVERRLQRSSGLAEKLGWAL